MSILELRVTRDRFVEYVVDGRVAYTSTVAIGPTESVHFVVAFHEHPSSVTDIELLQESVSNI